MGVNASIEGSNPSFSVERGGNRVSPTGPLLPLRDSHRNVSLPAGEAGLRRDSQIL